MNKRILYILIAVPAAVNCVSADKVAKRISLTGNFVTLSSSDVQIGSTLPRQQVLFPLPQNSADSTYSVRLLYPEYTKLKRKEARCYRRLFGSDSLASSPTLTYNTLRERMSSTLSAEFNPVVKRGRSLYYLSSYKAQLESTDQPTLAAETSAADRYAAHSVLASGRWAKISVAENGVHALTSEVCRQAGFSDISKVKIYGYGGAMVPETLTGDYLSAHDDLAEVPSLLQDGKRYFYAQGPVSYAATTSTTRIRNPYSAYGYYFITESDATPAACTEAELLAQQTASPNHYHTLHETDAFAWTESGRNLFDSQLIRSGKSQTYNLTIPKGNTSAKLTVVLTTAGSATVQTDIAVGDKNVATLTVRQTSSAYAKCAISQGTYDVDSLGKYAQEDGTISLPVTLTPSGGDARLDYILATYTTAGTLNLASCKSAAYVYNITNQDHHADTSVDLVIIIPTSQKLLSQAQALAQLHEQHDGMTTRIVPADELYNEFSSGTPDVSAYRRYLKMFYDRAESDSQIPTHVLLFGDALWDNRLLSVSRNNYSADDLLLCYETEDSYNYLSSYTTDDIIAILADGKTLTPYSGSDRTLQFDIAVGRIPVTTSTEAEGVVNKISSYMASPASGTWQNTVVFIGDDGDNNLHMTDNNANADAIIGLNKGFDVKKIMLDAYERQSTSVGNRYPAVNELIKQYQESGVLLMNYAGHGAPTLLTHESILTLQDVNAFTNTKYPMWITAACEVVPYDATTGSIGKSLLTNANGGAIAYYGATRTVLASRNASLNKPLTKYLLTLSDDGTPYTIGQAQRLAKNEITKNGTESTDNKHQYVLIGDPALRLAVPRLQTVIDEIQEVNSGATVNEDGAPIIRANSIVRVKGHVADASGSKQSSFNGMATLVVHDSEEQVTCRAHNGEEKPFVYTDHTSRLFQGTDSVRSGEFNITFRVPRDIHNDSLPALARVYATNQTLAAHGETSNFYVLDYSPVTNDSIGPNVYCYLNSPAFTNGATVGRTPYLVAEVSDRDGLDVMGTALGQNPQVVIDGQASKTYELTDYFTFDTGSYTSGQIRFVIPELEEGKHTLHLRVWDLLGNMTDVPLQFNVSRSMQPTISDVYVSPNPISGTATFYITTDMVGSEANVCVDLISTKGMVMQTVEWNTVLGGTTSLAWQPTGLPQGLYLYRVRISCDGYNYVSTTKKLIVQ